jgi:phosphoglycolate phosphatase
LNKGLCPPLLLSMKASTSTFDVALRAKISATEFRWSDADAYLFDIDGTLLNSRDGVHYNAFHAALRAVFGITAQIDGVPVHGNTDVGILRAVVRRHGIDDAEFERRLPQALEHMRNHVALHSDEMRPELCSGVPQLLDTLQSRGKLLGVVSGNLEEIGWAKLNAAMLKHYFKCGSFSGQRELRSDIFRHGIAEVRHQLGESAKICVVGDTPSDITAARENNVPVIAVATGIYGRDQLSVCAPQLCVGRLGDLLSESENVRMAAGLE